MLKIPLPGPPLLGHRIPGTLSLAILKTDTLATLPATTITLQAEIPDRLHHTIQEWVVHPDKDIPLRTHQHNAHLDMKEDTVVHQAALLTIITQDMGDLHHHLGAASMTKILVHRLLAMICTTEDGIEVDILQDLDIPKEVHRQRPLGLHHHRPIILLPPNHMTSIRKVDWPLEMGLNLGAPRAQVHQDPQVECNRKARG